MAPSAEPATRLCDICWKLDTLPRHITSDPSAGSSPPDRIRQAIADGADDAAIAQVMDVSTLIHHHECGARTGCTVCATVVAEVGGRTGDALAQAIASGAVDHLTDQLNTGEVDNTAPPGVADHPEDGPTSATAEPVVATGEEA